MSDNSASPKPSAELVSAKKNPYRRPGKGSKQKRTDDFREKKGAPELAKLHAQLHKNTYGDLDVEAGLELLAKLHIQQSHTEAQVPATTRAAGFNSQLIVDEATVVANRAVQNSGITAPQVYRVTLSQIAVQNHQAVSKSKDLQDAIVAPHQPERVPVDVSELIVTTGKTFGVLANVVNSFGLTKYGTKTYRTAISPHGSVELAQPAERAGQQRRALARFAMLPNPYRVTIQSLREVVVALSNVETPQAVRHYFRINNPIPGAIWDENDILLNPDLLCAEDYFNSAMFMNDINTYRRFISSAGAKMNHLFGECTFTGLTNMNMFVSSNFEHGRIDGNNVMVDSDVTFRSQFELNDQQFLHGALALIGENEQNYTYSFRDPTSSTSRIDLSWKALTMNCLVKE